MKIAILGYGVVGSGVAEVLHVNRTQITKRTKQEIEVKYILDTRQFPGDPLEGLMVSDFGVIEGDSEVKLVVEAIGGDTIAYEFVKRAIMAGKSVCTPNKALVAAHGPELIALAREKGVCFLFEASVGGGIPLIRPFADAMVAVDEVQSIAGILNGTSNYILTQMSTNGKSYAEALKRAQELGYAEQDPTADVSSQDACRKLSIMLSLVTGKQADYQKIKTEGIEKISAQDFAFANALGFTLKQVVSGKICGSSGVEAIAAPFLVPLSHPLATVNDVYNGFWATGKTTGNIMFYGSGAGKLPTASAVVSNIADAVCFADSLSYTWTSEEVNILPWENYSYRKMIRVSYEDKSVLEGVDGVVTIGQYPNCAAWVVPAETEAETVERVARIGEMAGVRVLQVLRVYE
ncbi:MAG: homoserine dehydrogenase [Defluviitaleaceae bacterium]|nr:homoserine dehydrogenase [Defluviitaleaceae bacterium]